jgi:hypothetical protein
MYMHPNVDKPDNLFLLTTKRFKHLSVLQNDKIDIHDDSGHLTALLLPQDDC